MNIKRLISAFLLITLNDFVITEAERGQLQEIEPPGLVLSFYCRNSRSRFACTESTTFLQSIFRDRSGGKVCEPTKASLYGKRKTNTNNK